MQSCKDEMIEILKNMFRFGARIDDDEEDAEPILQDNSIDAVAQLIKSGEAKNVVVMSGAGVSTACGIPDFRTPGTGLYDNLQKYNLPEPTAVFSIDYFRKNPQPFYELARELYPGTVAPSLAHCFVKLLEERGLLLRNFTQNIDNLERVAGVSGEKLVEAHGTFATCHCIECGREIKEKAVKEVVFQGEIPRCSMFKAEDDVDTEGCDGLVKPDIVFFGENLPKIFAESIVRDLPQCDLLIVMGTSLKVQPFASLISRVPSKCPRLLINRERVGEEIWPGGFKFDSKRNRDVFHAGDCDHGVRDLCRALGEDWEQKLDDIFQKTRHQAADT